MVEFGLLTLSGVWRYPDPGNIYLRGVASIEFPKRSKQLDRIFVE
jgi:hypothetical protein